MEMHHVLEMCGGVRRDGAIDAISVAASSNVHMMVHICKW